MKMLRAACMVGVAAALLTTSLPAMAQPFGYGGRFHRGYGGPFHRGYGGYHRGPYGYGGGYGHGFGHRGFHRGFDRY